MYVTKTGKLKTRNFQKTKKNSWNNKNDKIKINRKYER